VTLRVPGWLLPAVGYIFTVGAIGITTKLALRTLEWQQIILLAPIAYALWAAGFVLFGGARFPTGIGALWATLTVVCASAGLVVISFALTKGDASRVVPVSSAYPLVTVFGAAIFLSERVTLMRGLGTALVVVGVALLSR
jgi:bacterial/archaeal transporter family protein